MYAEVADVLARGGRISAAWTETSSPSLSDLERFLDARQGEIDSALASRGVDLPVTDDVAKTALRSMHAAGALVLALSATFPNKEGPAAAAELMGVVSAEWAQGIAGVAQGTHATVPYLLGVGGADAAVAEFGFAEDDDDYPPKFDRDEVF